MEQDFEWNSPYLSLVEALENPEGGGCIFRIALLMDATGPPWLTHKDQRNAASNGPISQPFRKADRHNNSPSNTKMMIDQG